MEINQDIQNPETPNPSDNGFITNIQENKPKTPKSSGNFITDIQENKPSPADNGFITDIKPNTPSKPNDALFNLLKNAIPAKDQPKPTPVFRLLTSPEHLHAEYSSIPNTPGQLAQRAQVDKMKFDAAMTSATGDPYKDGLTYLAKTDPSQVMRIQNLEKSGVPLAPQQKFEIENTGIQNNLAALSNAKSQLQPAIDELTQAIEAEQDPVMKQHLIAKLQLSPEYQKLNKIQDEYDKMSAYGDNVLNKYPEIKGQIEQQKKDQAYYDSLPGVGKLWYDLDAGVQNFFTSTLTGAARTANALALSTGMMSGKRYEQQSQEAEKFEGAHTDITTPNKVGGVVRGIGDLIPNILLLATGEGAVTDALEGTGIFKTVSPLLGRTAAIGATSFGNYFDAAHRQGYNPAEAAMIGSLGTLKDVALMSINAPTEEVNSAIGNTGEFLDKVKSEGVLNLLKDPENAKIGLQRVKNIALSTLKHGATGTAQAIAFNQANQKFDDIINSKPAINAQNVNDLRQNMLINGLASAIIPLVGGLSSIGDFRNRYFRDALYETGQHPETYLTLVDQKVAAGDFSQQEGIDIKQRITAMGQINKLVQDRALPYKAKKQISINQFNKIGLEEKAKTALTDEEKQDIQNKISVLDNNTNHLLGIKADQPTYTIADQPVTQHEAQAAVNNGIPDVQGEDIDILNKNSLNLGGGKETDISQRVPSEELGSSNEVHSQEQDIQNRLGQGIREAETQLQRPLSNHEKEDIERQSTYDYAKEQGLWIDNLYSLGEPTGIGGNENTLALDKENSVIYKANNLFNSQHSISKFLDGIQAHNKLFPEDKYELVGFTGLEKGAGGVPYVEPVVKQDYVPDATQATQDEIDHHMKEMGFEKVNDHTFRNGDYTVSDLRPRNVLKDKEGNIHVVDDIVTENNPQTLKTEQNATTESKGPLEEGHQQTGISEHQGVGTSREEEAQSGPDNSNSGTNGPGEEIRYAVEPPKPIREMNSEELYNYSLEVRKELKKQDKLFEGKSEEEKEAGGYYNVRDNVEDLRDASKRINYIENSEDLNELANSVKSVLKNLSKNPSEETLAILNAAKKKADEMGVSTNDLIKEVVKKVGSQYKDPEDAELMMRDAFDKLTAQPEKVISNSKTNNNENEEKGESQENAGKESQKEGLPSGNVENSGTAPSNSGEGVAEPETTGIKNKVTESERAERGESPVEVEGKRSFGSVWDEGKRMVDNGETDIRSLTKIWAKKPVPLTPEQSAALVYDRMRLHNSHKQAMTTLAEATGDPEAEQVAREQLSLIEQDIEANDEAARKTGYEQGLGLAIRRMMTDDTYSLANQLLLMKAENGGRELSPALRAKLEQYSKELEAAKSQIEKHQQRISELEAAKVVNRMARTARRNMTREQLADERKQIFEDIKKVAREQAATMSANPIPAKLVPLIAKLARNYVEGGINELGALVDKIVGDLKGDIPNIDTRSIRDAISGYEKPKVNITRPEAEQTLNELKSQAKLISKIEDIESGKPVSRLSTARQKSERVKELNRRLADAMKKAGIPHNSADPRQAFKTRVTNRISDLEAKIKAKDFETVKRPKMTYDEDMLKLQAQYNRIKDKFDLEREKLRKKNRTTGRKFIDAFQLWRRAALLSSTSVLGKLSVAAAARTITTPIEEAIALALNKIPGISAIAKSAPREGRGFYGRAEAKAISQFWQKATYKDFGKILKTGKSELDVLHGEKKSLPAEALEMIGHLHSVLKSPVKRAEYFRSMEHRLAYMAKQGKDIYDPVVQATAGAQAYIDANRSIFMQDNPLTDKFGATIREWINSDNDFSKGMGQALQFFFPMTRVATNFAGESMSYVAGGVKVLPNIARAIRNGIRDREHGLTEKQADFVMRNLKKQTIGAAFMALGYYGYNSIGGFYQQHEKRSPEDVPADKVRIFGVDLPRWTLDAPIFMAMQLGATLRRVKDKYESKGKQGGFEAGAISGIHGVFENVPFLNFPTQITHALESQTGLTGFAGETARSVIVPPDVQRIAKATDKDENGNPVVRKPKTIWQNIEYGIPGLRKRVPKKQQPKVEDQETL